MDLDPAQRLKFSNICTQLQTRCLIAAAYLNELMLPFSLLAHRVITTLVISWLTASVVALRNHGFGNTWAPS
jgi:hypothetical protein